MAKAKQSRSESSNEDLLERIQQLEARLTTVEAGLEAEAALFAVSPPRPATSARAASAGSDGPLNGFAHGSDGGSTAAGTTLATATSTAPPAPREPSGPREPGGTVGGAPSFADRLADEFDDDADEAEGVDPEAVSDAAARRKQPDSPIPFTPGDLRSRLGKPGGVMFTGAARLPRGVRAAWQNELAMVDLLDADWGAEAEQVAALAHPVRLALLREVLKGARSVSALASLPGLGTSGQLYHHLKPLLAEGWLQPAGRGRYEVPNDRVLPLLGVIAAVRRP
jgi:hypothetical protein